MLPREDAILREFAEHLSADAKILEEDEETGAKRYKYIRTGADHFGLAFCYAWLATTWHHPYEGLIEYMRMEAKRVTDAREGR